MSPHRRLELHSCLFLLAAVLSFGTAGAGKQVTARRGGTVILPCSTALGSEVPDVEWSRQGPTPEVVLLYRDGCETFEMKSEDFRYRTHLILSELKDGNISLRISDLRLSDGGTYLCRILPGRRVVETLELVVGAVSEPKLEVLSYADDGVTVQCEAKCWSPEPEIELHGDIGISNNAGKPQRVQENKECITIRRNLTLQAATKRVTCRVHQVQTGQIKVTEMPIPVCSLRQLYSVWIVLTIVILLVSAILFSLRKRFGCIERCGFVSKSPDLHTSVKELSTPPGQPPAQSSPAADGGYAELQRENQNLRLRLSEKEEINRSLTERLSQLEVTQSPDRQKDRSPKKSKSLSKPLSPRQRYSILPSNSTHPDITGQNQTLGHNSHRQRSNTDSTSVRSSSLPASTSNGVGHHQRSASFSHLDRSFRSARASSNRFSPLLDLPEDQEDLIKK
ncbi:butyrophilin subfamily 1 member A1-like [Menidia menidia]